MVQWVAKVIRSRPVKRVRGPHPREPTGSSQAERSIRDKGLYLQLESRQWDEQAFHYDLPRVRDPIYMAGIEAAVRALAPQDGDLILDAAC